MIIKQNWKQDKYSPLVSSQSSQGHAHGSEGKSPAPGP